MARTETPTSAKTGPPHAHIAQSGQDQHQPLHRQGEDDVLTNDGQGLAGDAHRLGQLGEVIVHKHDVRRLDGRIRAQRSHSHTDVRPGEDGGIVVPSPHKNKIFLGLLLGQQALHLVHFVSGQQLGVELIQTQLPGHALGGALGVAR